MFSEYVGELTWEGLYSKDGEFESDFACHEWFMDLYYEDEDALWFKYDEWVQAGCCGDVWVDKGLCIDEDRFAVDVNTQLFQHY